MNSTNTSSISQSSTNYRQKGKLPSSHSKVYKGFIHDATSKLSVGSIPAKFETIVFRNQSQRAFGSSNPRFVSEINDIPGPQEYDFKQQYTISESKATESLSKRGYGGFITTEERTIFMPRYTNCGPGPGNYQEASFFNESKQDSKAGNKSICLTRLSSSLKTSTGISDDPRVKLIYPGPGEQQYVFLKQHSQNRYNAKLTKTVNTFQSAFVSKTQRDQYMKQPKAPAPGQYNIKRSFLFKKPENQGPSSSFYPEIEHKKQQSTQDRLMNFLEDPIEKCNKAQDPGPCDYSMKKPDFDPEYVGNSESLPFRMSQRDRFGDYLDKSRIIKDTLGPGVYEIKGQLETIAEEKTQVQGAVFMSEALRKPYGDYEQRLGPNTAVAYIQPKKKDFLLNMKTKWV